MKDIFFRFKSRTQSFGFTLIELLVVIVIIGILATISVAQLSDYQEKARLARGMNFSSLVHRQLLAELTADQKISTLLLDFESTDADTSGAKLVPISNTATHYVGSDECLMGHCYYFDGINDSIVYDKNNFSMNSTDGFVISAFIKFDDLDSLTSASRIFRYGSNTVDVISLALHPTGTKPSLALEVGSHNNGDYTWTTVNIDKIVLEDKWHHIMVTAHMAEDISRLYFDGELLRESNINLPTDFVASNGHISIGSIHTGAGGTQFFKGYMDNLRIYPLGFTP